MTASMKRGSAAVAILLGLLVETSAADPQARVGDASHQTPPGTLPLQTQTPAPSPAPLNPVSPTNPTVMFFAVLMPALEGAPTGGMQLDVDPRSAGVYVDGAHVGLVREFSGYYKHLELVAGPHLVTIVSPDHEPLIIPVMVCPGCTLTYRGTLARAHGR